MCEKDPDPTWGKFQDPNKQCIWIHKTVLNNKDVTICCCFLLAPEGAGPGLLLELGHPVVDPAHVDPGGVVGVVQVYHAPARVHHRVLLVVLDQLRQAVEHLAPVHVELFVHVPS